MLLWLKGKYVLKLYNKNEFLIFECNRKYDISYYLLLNSDF